MTTTVPAATDILLFRTLAAARGEGMPELGVRLGCLADPPELELYLDSAEDSQRWQEWFTRHAADDWTFDNEEVQDGYRYHYAWSVWRGWRLELVYLTEVELEAGVAGD